MPAIVVPGEHGHWIVREDDGCELGHYPNQDTAKAVEHKLPLKYAAAPLIHDGGGEVHGQCDGPLSAPHQRSLS